MKKAFILGIALIISISACAALAAPASVTSEGPLGTAGVGKQEVSLGDLVADAIRSALGTDLAFVSASELKDRDSTVAKGKVTAADVAAYVAYSDDPVVRVNLTGKQIRLALERGVLIYPQKNLGFLQVSGIRFAFDSGKPQESRVTSVRTESGASLSDGDTYSVAMTSSLANGALGYWKIWSKGDIKEPAQQITIPEAVESFFTGRDRVDYTTQSRITIGG